MNKYQAKKAFTLVELIVVIVILAILATIAFLSFSSQSASARDSTRLADISNIAKWLGILKASSWKYPKPDNAVSLTASGLIIWYQWEAWSSVLNMIKMNQDWWKDPLEKNYYTFSANSDFSKMELLGFLEDGSNAVLSYSPFDKAFESSSAYLSDYSKRYPYSKWDPIGVILSSGSLVPIQATWTWIDITAGWSYVIQLDNKAKATGSWNVLKYAIMNDWLAWYWSFDEWIGTSSHDWSGNGNDWNFSWWIIFVGWKSWFWVTPNTNTWRILLNFDPSIIMWDFAVSVWVLFNDFNNDYNQIIHTINWNWISLSWKWPTYAPYNNRTAFYLQQYDQYTRSNSMNSTWSSIVSTWIWHNLVVTRKWTTSYFYIDWVIDQTSSDYRNITYTGTTLSLMNNNNPWLNTKLNWIIDEFRIYRRSLTDAEIQNMYSIFR
ncbi:MAG: hypothetical protein ACD_3C00142G0002 [uncultured bacterium (gcode 4)]|uniref:Prepilin-type N-terminal cleavage/methylation domain-containing protein n=1 Tax=uncultured bacterium (gcode 4) TaxID=1234023 RepID=K2F9P0_9BACT|nr:MAG: hypothetical protein ACD_3C00142G0002 [uncultured bacterium (gcode 4)]